MHIHFHEDLYETVVEHHICDHHKNNPLDYSVSCTCSFSMKQMARSPEEISRIRKKRQQEHEDAVLEEADQIRGERKKSKGRQWAFIQRFKNQLIINR